LGKSLNRRLTMTIDTSNRKAYSVLFDRSDMLGIIDSEVYLTDEELEGDSFYEKIDETTVKERGKVFNNIFIRMEEKELRRN